MKSMILRPGCRGVKSGGDTGVCGALVRWNGLTGRVAVLLVANGMIRTVKQLPEVSRTAVWGRVVLYLAGEEYWKGDCDLRFVVDEVYDTSTRLPGGQRWGRYWCMWGWSEV
jgi:hypothetical protein